MILWFSKDRMHPGPFRDRRTWSVILKGKYWISKGCGVSCKRSRNVSTNWRQACDIQRRLYHLLKIKRRAHESMNLKGQSLIFANWRSQTSRPFHHKKQDINKDSNVRFSSSGSLRKIGEISAMSTTLRSVKMPMKKFWCGFFEPSIEFHSEAVLRFYQGLLTNSVHGIFVVSIYEGLPCLNMSNAPSRLNALGCNTWVLEASSKFNCTLW